MTRAGRARGTPGKGGSCARCLLGGGTDAAGENRKPAGVAVQREIAAPAFDRFRVRALTTSSTAMFAIIATMPTFKSVTADGQSGKSFASVVPVSDVHAIVATPVAIPAMTPAGVAS